jgi:predicted Zn finger-like uncharacterized protein
MFTVCPKCALTLVVTAQDLRVAQGYVRCGRCSNVFNALARLSEDRNAAPGATASQPAPGSTGVHPRPTSPAAPEPAAAPSPQTPAPAQAPAPRPPQPTASYTYTRPPETPAPRQPPPPSAARPAASRPPPPGTLSGGDLYDDEAIPEDALEFNPNAADVDKVFVEPPPHPEWTAATGTFKALVLKAEEPAQDDEIELDPDFLSSTNEMRKLKLGLPESDTGSHPKLENNTAASPISSASAEPTRQPPAKPPQNRAAPPSGGTYPAPAHPTPPRTTPGHVTSGHAAPGHAPPAHIGAPPAGAQTFAPATRPAPPKNPTGETQSQPQLHDFLSETQSQPRPRPVPPETIPDPAARTPGRKSVRAFGLDSAEPPPAELRLANLARSRIAPASLELEPPSRLEQLLRLTRLLSGSPTVWSAGAITLAILLTVQVVNHYRNDLAASTQFTSPITALYGVFGVTLTPHWDLHVYDVRQLGASVDPESKGQIMVRASVKNGGHQAQPMPLLRVTLQDRFGNRIAARDVAPGSYLPRALPAASFLSAGQRIDAEMAFVDPGSNAVGFEIDACLPAPAGGISCANDPVSR